MTNHLLTRARRSTTLIYHPHVICEHAIELIKIHEPQTQNVIHHLLQIGGPIGINLTDRSSAVFAKRNLQSSLNTEETLANKIKK